MSCIGWKKPGLNMSSKFRNFFPVNNQLVWLRESVIVEVYIYCFSCFLIARVDADLC